jgi:hypothetical protein
MAKGMSGLCPCMRVSDTLQLKKEYDIVKELRNLSGFGWDDAMKHVKVLPAVWDEYLKVRLAHIYVGLTCSSHLPLPFRVTTRRNPSARRDSLYSTSSATSSTALALLVSSRSGQAKPQALHILGTRPLLLPPETTLTLGLILSSWVFPKIPLSAVGPTPHCYG